MFFEIFYQAQQTIIKFLIKLRMGCGALSNGSQVLEPQLQFRKTKSLYKSEEAEIWTCENHNKQKFTVKVFKKIFITDENQSMLKNFQQEINRLRSLTTIKQNQKNQTEKTFMGQHLMPYIKAWKDEAGNLSLIMNYIQEKSLGEQIKGRLPGLFNEIITAKLTYQILSTIKYLRQNGSIFCNFKPTNVFLTKNKQNVIMTDYYNLEEYFKLNETSIFKNPIYSAPQNVLFNQHFQESDIWRVGCFIIEMLTCIKPWYKETTDKQKIIQNLKNHIRPPFPDKISPICKSFLQKCFQTDHNRRTSLQLLLRHDFIIQNQQKTSLYPKIQNSHIYERQNTENQEIGSYNFQVQLIQESPLPKTKKQIKTQKSLYEGQAKITNITSTNANANRNINIEQMSPLQKINQNYITRKKSNSSHYEMLASKKYEIHKINSENDENIVDKNTSEMRKSSNIRSKRIKTEAHAYQTELNQHSPYVSKKSQKQILALLNKVKQDDLTNSPYTSPKLNRQNGSRKISKTSNFRLSKSKKKIPTNQITLNNQAIQFHENSSSRYWKSPQVETPYDYLQTAEKITRIMKQIQEQGGQKYYKKPLKLLKQKLKLKTSALRTETSIAIEDSYLNYNRQCDEQGDDNGLDEIIKFDTQNNLTTEDDSFNYNQTENSKVSIQPSHENEVIQTMASKAERMRYESQHRYIREQRQNEKKKWEKQLKQGREFIKNQINSRYHFSRSKMRVYTDKV